MTQEANIFGNQTTETQTQQPATNVQSSDPIADLLGSIRNERGEPKYRDLNTALDALKHSQEFIPQLKTDKEKLEQELNALRAEVERLKTVESSVEQLTSQRTTQEQPPAVGLSEEAIANLVTKTLSKREQEVVRTSNLNSVVEVMRQSFGDKASDMFYEKAREIGMSAEAINSLAAQSPQAVLQLFGVKKTDAVKNASTNTNQGSINTSGYQPQKETFLGRNSKPVILGATTQELGIERQNSKQLVEELHSQGLSTYDLTDPKQYFKYFGQK